MQAMILAAGFGTRLLPYTRIIAKPLFPLLNVPLLKLTIAHLKNTGFDHIIVNCHHLREQVKALVDPLERVYLQEEELILGTGGGLALGRKLMRSEEPLLVTNGDIYHTIDLSGFYRSHQQSGAAVSLAVHDLPRFNCLSVEDDSLVSVDPIEKHEILAFTGLHVIDPGVLQPIDTESSSCILDRYRDMLSLGESIRVDRVDGRFWKDMGTVQDYLDLHGGMLVGQIERWPEFGDTSAGPLLIHKEAQCKPDLQVDGWACVGRATIGRNVTLRRTVVWDGAVIPDNTDIADTIVTAKTDD